MSKATQPYLPAPTTPVQGSAEFSEFKDLYAFMDKVLLESGLDLIFSLKYVDAMKEQKEREAKSKKQNYEMSEASRTKYQIQGIEAFRCTMVRAQMGLSYRKLNVTLASNVVLQDFCKIRTMTEVQVPSRSSLQKYETLVPAKELSEIFNQFNEIIFKDQQFSQELAATDLYLDSTCIKAHMHYPVDWLLLRDGCRTMMKAVILIRKVNVLNRMDQSPQDFLSDMNALCVKMSAASRKRDGGKARKAAFREMKKLEKKIRKHAQRHLNKFELEWPQTIYTEKRAQVVINRLRQTIEIMPKVVKQAHERIIGGRLVANKDKILSLYQDDVHVIKRRKDEANNEFGSKLMIAEEASGLIVGFEFEKEQVSDDSQLLADFLAKYEDQFERAPDSICTDRGFHSPANTKLLDSKGIFNAICPKSVSELREKLKDETFRSKLKRRGPNEARVGILKNNFLSSALKAFGYERRHQAVHWGIISHNLVKVARLLVAEAKEKALEEAEVALLKAIA